MSETSELKSRIAELEFQLAHMQRIFDQLNEVVTDHASLIDRMQRRIAKLEPLVSDLKQASETATDPLDEKPPHY